jgi:hypothetical protein
MALNHIFSIEKSRVPFLEEQILDMLPEHTIGKKNEKHWIIPVHGPKIESTNHEELVFNQFLGILGQRGYTELMVTK